ncbi:MAG TPA: hypothetical protein VJG32_18080 [Anaerolineae bacterium]|nr:hypothetical protein [Anaerolineae bacterium]
MWCDTFDMDLPKIIPDAMQAIAPVRNIVLYTHGGARDGVINHPAVWSTYSGSVAFFGFHPETIKDESYYTNDPVVRCSFEEAVRDAWPHTYIIALNWFKVGRGWRQSLVWDSFRLKDHFDILMYDLRRWRTSPIEVIEQSKRYVVKSLEYATQQLQLICRQLPVGLETEP